MKLNEIYNQKHKMIISYEVFPPKGEGEEYEQKVSNLLSELKKLEKFNPSLISVTYGAGGSTQTKTLDLISIIKNEIGVDTMPHFTCVNSDKKFVKDYIKKIEEMKIDNILALRGDAPLGSKSFQVCNDGFAYASELVKFIKENSSLSVAVAGYTTKHPEAISEEEDINNLVKKVNCGADVIYTQMFFDNEKFFKFYDGLKLRNVTIPVIPGIMIVQSFSQIERIIELSNVKLPDSLDAELKDNKNKPEEVKKIGIDFAKKQVKELLDFGVKGLHFFPLNKSYAVSKVLEELL